MQFIVICREDSYDGGPGDFTLATRTLFPTKEEAEKYASGIHESRQPLVVGGRFNELRNDSSERFGNAILRNS